jgi:hypothetical protein
MALKKYDLTFKTVGFAAKKNKYLAVNHSS